MKKLHSLILLLVLCVSCLPVEEEDDTQLRQWKMTGKASFESNSDDATADVKLGLFYVAGTTMPTSLTTSYTLVSDPLVLGRTGGETSFTMSVDCTKTKPSDNQYLMMFMWRDTDDNGAFTSGETSSQVLAQAGSVSFLGDVTNDVVCHYVYELEYDTERGTTKGWNQVCGDIYKNVKSIAIRRSGEDYLPDAIVKAKSIL